MANEIKYKWFLQLADGVGITHKTNFPTKKVSTTAAAPVEAKGGTQDIPTGSHEALVLGDVTTPGMGWIKNLDTTNFVEIGIDAAGVFHPLVKILPGEAYPFRFTDAPYGEFDSGAGQIQYWISQE